MTIVQECEYTVQYTVAVLSTARHPRQYLGGT